MDGGVLLAPYVGNNLDRKKNSSNDILRNHNGSCFFRLELPAHLYGLRRTTKSRIDWLKSIHFWMVICL